MADRHFAPHFSPTPLTPYLRPEGRAEATQAANAGRCSGFSDGVREALMQVAILLEGMGRSRKMCEECAARAAKAIRELGER